MDINFSNTDIIFIYGHFRKEARKLNELKAMPDCPIDKSSIDAEIELYNSIADKMRSAEPSLSKLDNYRI